MGQITFKGGSVIFKGGSLKFLSYTPMLEPTVYAWWTYSGGVYKSQVSITNNDTQIAKMWYRINDLPPAGQYININPGETYTVVVDNSPIVPPYGTVIKGQAQAIDENGLRASSNTITDTASSQWDF